MALNIHLGNVAVTVLRGPLEALAGAAYGALLGIIISYVPHKHHVSKL